MITNNNYVTCSHFDVNKTLNNYDIDIAINNRSSFDYYILILMLKQQSFLNEHQIYKITTSYVVLFLHLKHQNNNMKDNAYIHISIV